MVINNTVLSWIVAHANNTRAWCSFNHAHQHLMRTSLERNTADRYEYVSWPNVWMDLPPFLDFLSGREPMQFTSTTRISLPSLS